ncbi:MAG: hypothetical protein JXB48_17080 [Candidatus Latescibacteria bacterium]|nr:hypothetical protein [Candidatus Latescibacterota bacterium]
MLWDGNVPLKKGDVTTGCDAQRRCGSDGGFKIVELITNIDTIKNIN